MSGIADKIDNALIWAMFVLAYLLFGAAVARGSWAMVVAGFASLSFSAGILLYCKPY